MLRSVKESAARSANDSPTPHALALTQADVIDQRRGATKAAVELGASRWDMHRL
eukprot:COSAG01_NODE_44962_length_414_cov_0.425397_1_plen_53_part_01